MTDFYVDEMGERITEAIKAKLVEGGLEIADISFQELRDRKTGALSRPVANISINQGVYSKVVMYTFKQNTTVSIFVMVQNLKGEKIVRNGMYLLIHAIARILLLEKLGLPLQDPLIPVNFNNVTDDEFAKAGYMIYQLNLTCSFNFVKDTEKDLGAFTKIVNTYFLQDPSDDGIADASGIVLFSEIDGGHAGSLYVLPPIDGGFAGSKFEEPEINGGHAGSTY